MARNRRLGFNLAVALICLLSMTLCTGYFADKRGKGGLELGGNQFLHKRSKSMARSSIKTKSRVKSVKGTQTSSLGKKEIEELVKDNVRKMQLDLWGLNNENDVKVLILQLKKVVDENSILRAEIETLKNRMSPNCEKGKRDGSKSTPSWFTNPLSARKIKTKRYPKGPSRDNEEESCIYGIQGQKGAKGDPGPSLQAPSILTKSYTLWINEGENINLQCIVKGNPAPKVTWYGAGSIWNITNINNGTRVVSKASKSNATHADARKYQCRAESVLGNSWIDIHVNVYVTPKVSLAFNTIIGRTNAVVEFPRCNVIASPPALIDWERAFSRLPLGRHYFKSNKEIFGIRKAQLVDSGYYYCKARNSLGQSRVPIHLIITSEKFEMNLIPPSIVYLVKSVQLTCGAKGYPRPVVDWHNESMKINHTQQITKAPDESRAVTLISSLGDYTCVAKSGGEMITTRTKVAEFLLPSRILEGNLKLKNELGRWLQERVGYEYKWSLCYSPSNSGQFSVSSFHQHCDGKSHTVTIVKSGKNIFGGYSDVSWEAPTYGSFSYSNKSFLFSLMREQSFSTMPIQLFPRPEGFHQAIYLDRNKGPIFGAGPDLVIASKRRYGMQISSKLGKTYKLPGFNCCLDDWFNGYSMRNGAKEIEIFYATK